MHSEIVTVKRKRRVAFGDDESITQLFLLLIFKLKKYINRKFYLFYTSFSLRFILCKILTFSNAEAEVTVIFFPSCVVVVEV